MSYEVTRPNPGMSIRKVEWTLTTDSNGDVSEATTEVLTGKILGCYTNPDNTIAPTANWDLTILGTGGVDVLLGAGQNRDSGGADVSEYANISNGPLVVSSALTAVIDNGGDGKKAVITLLIEED